jgi:hypothetical protein
VTIVRIPRFCDPTAEGSWGKENENVNIEARFVVIKIKREARDRAKSVSGMLANYLPTFTAPLFCLRS